MIKHIPAYGASCNCRQCQGIGIRIALESREWEMLYLILWDFTHDSIESDSRIICNEVMEQLRKQGLNPLEER